MFFLENLAGFNVFYVNLGYSAFLLTSTYANLFPLFIPHIPHVSSFLNTNHLIIRLLSISFIVIDRRNIYNIHHAISHDLPSCLTISGFLSSQKQTLMHKKGYT